MGKTGIHARNRDQLTQQLLGILGIHNHNLCFFSSTYIALRHIEKIICCR
jgi:hypothetical protein